jgi:hypothetical protein
VNQLAMESPLLAINNLLLQHLRHGARLLLDEALDGHERILKCKLELVPLIIDEIGMKQLPKRSDKYHFEVVMRRHDLRSKMITSKASNPRSIFLNHMFLTLVLTSQRIDA